MTHSWHDGVSTSQAARLSGLSYRQIDYWLRTGIVTPSIAEARGSGTQRRWSEEDILLLRRARQLLDAGISLQRIRSAVPFIRDAEGCRWLFVSGSEVGVCAAGELEQSLQGEASVIIDLRRAPSCSPQPVPGTVDA